MDVMFNYVCAQGQSQRYMRSEAVYTSLGLYAANIIGDLYPLADPGT